MDINKLSDKIIIYLFENVNKQTLSVVPKYWKDFYIFIFT